MRTDYRERLAVAGFSRLEIAAIELIAVCCGLLTCCEHERPKFVQVFAMDEEIDSDSGLTFSEARWRKHMSAVGFRTAAVILAEDALGLLGEGGTA